MYAYACIIWCIICIIEDLVLLPVEGMGQDYLDPASLEVVFPVGAPATQCATFEILDDSALEGPHDFEIEITGAGPFAAIGTPSTTTITIDDNERE